MSLPRRLLLSPRAAADLEEIADCIARDNPARAAAFVAGLEAKCRAVAAASELYPSRTDLAPGLRMAVHGRTLVLYRDLPGEDTVRIERVLHSARNLPRLLQPPIPPSMGAGRRRCRGAWETSPGRESSRTRRRRAPRLSVAGQGLPLRRSLWVGRLGVGSGRLAGRGGRSARGAGAWLNSL